MKILFDTSFDGRAWPVWSGELKGTAGVIRLGQLGLLGYLETILGLRGPDVPEAVRVASLIPSVENGGDRFWSKSAEVDPFGVARRLINLHDFLIFHGWNGQADSSRLADLASLTGDVMPGAAQRLQGVLDGLDDFEGELPQLIVHEEVEALPPLWQSVFQMLEKKGVTVKFEPFAAAIDSDSDLGNARKGVFTPKGDGSLQLVRRDGVLQAAEDVAAWLAALMKEGDLEDTVIIGGDAVLDHALHRFGLPVCGAKPENGNALLELFPLVLAMGFNPPDPERIMELLTMPVSPVPPGIGRRLRKALGKWPALGSVLWNQRLEEGLAAIEDDDRRIKVAKRLEVLFTPVEGEEYSIAELKKRLEMLVGWLKAYFKDDPSAYAPINQCSVFMEMLEAMKVEHVDEPLLKRLLDEATSGQVVPPPLPAQAGLGAVSEPEAVGGMAKRVVWWNFNRESVSSLTLPLFSQEENEVLAEAGVILPDSSVLTNRQAVRWRRPLDFAEEQLMLICPRRDYLGEELHPHPLWDELMAASGEKAKILVTEKIKSTEPISVVTPRELPLPQPELNWQVAHDTVTQREVESPSSLENFFGCPLKWCLGYGASIRGSHMTALPNLVPTLGSLAHELVEEILLLGELPAPEDGANMVAEFFDHKAPYMVATIFQNGMEVEKERVRHTVIMATRSLLQHFHDAGIDKVSVEQKLSGCFSGQKLEGFADIVVDKPFTVVDLKRSWANLFKKKMSSGTALQIVLYGWLLKEVKGVFPELAYYTLEDQSFLTTDQTHFPRGEVVETPPIEDVWRVFEETYNKAWDILKTGVVLCPGNGDDVESRIEDGRLILETPCRFCDYDVLCGRRFK